MDTITDCALRTFFVDRRDLFGENSAFLRFELEPVFSSSAGYQSKSLFGRLVYQDGSGNIRQSASLMLKLTPQHSKRTVYVKTQFLNEILFYTQLQPHFSSLRNTDRLFPEFYSSQLYATAGLFEGVIIFENLQASGFEMSASKSFLDYPHLTLMMKKLGEFHAYSYSAKNTDPVRYSELVHTFSKSQFILFDAWSSRLPSIAARGIGPLRGDPQYASKMAELEKFVESSAAVMNKIMCEDEANSLAVLCHGDYLQGNLLFKYDRGKPVDAKMIDLATCTLASPVLDLAQTLYLHTDQRMRDQHWDDLVDEYHRSLSETFPSNVVPSKDVIVAELQQKASFAYIIASYFITWLISHDQNLPSYFELLPTEYQKVSLHDIPGELWIQTNLALAGDLGTTALADILRDMINRGIL